MAEIEINTSSTADNIEVTADTEATTQEVQQQQEEPQQQQQQNTEEQDQETPEADPVQVEMNKQVELESQLKEELNGKGISFEELDHEFTENGELSEETLKKLEKAGYPRTAISAYLDNLELRAEKFANAVVSYAGTEQDFANLQEYVKAQGKEATDVFNSVLQTGNLAIIKAHINGIKAQMGNAYGSSRPTIMGNGVVPQGQTQGFQTQNEMVTAISDPRYKNDKVYRAEVEAKVKMTDFSNL